MCVHALYRKLVASLSITPLARALIGGFVRVKKLLVLPLRPGRWASADGRQ